MHAAFCLMTSLALARDSTYTLISDPGYTPVSKLTQSVYIYRLRHTLMNQLLIALPILCSAFLSTVALAAEGGHHPHHIAVVGGIAYHDSEESGYLGVEYSYRFSDRWSLGGFYEEVSGDFDLQVLGLVANRHFTSGWKIGAGPGIERKIKKNKDLLLLRLTGGYDWHLGNWSVGPTATYDVIEAGESTGYLGIAVGIGF